MHRARLRRAALAVLLAVVPLAAEAASATLTRIRDAGVVRFAFRESAAPFSFRDEAGRARGYSVELCERVADALKKSLALPELRIEWKPVDAASRLPAVAGGDVDVECGTTTVSLARMESVDFSVPIFVDGGSVLVRADAKLATLADLKGKRIAVIAGTTTEQALARQLSEAKASAVLVPVRDAPEGLAQLVAGKVDGYAGDRIVLVALRQRAAKTPALALLGNDFSYEPYALVVRRDDPDFRLAVNRALVGLYRSGEIDAIFQRWFASLGRPGPLLHAMFYLHQFPD
jgi:ABC-type amino acid transport substrate-binding protein